MTNSIWLSRNLFHGVEHQEEIPEEVWDWLENEYKIPAKAPGNGDAESSGPQF